MAFKMTACALLCTVIIALMCTECSAFSRAFTTRTNNQRHQVLSRLFKLQAAPGPTMAKSQTPTVVGADGEVSYDEGEFLYDEDDEDDEDFDDDDRDGFERTSRKSGKPLGNNE